jgi:hypothetical protein
MTSKIAIVKVSRCEYDGKLDNNPFAEQWMKETHLRYTAWSPKNMPKNYEDVHRERVVLVYENTTLDEIVPQIEYDFSCRKVAASWGSTAQPKYQIHVRAYVEARATFDIEYLGDYEDIACYAIVTAMEPTVGHIGITRMPIYGRGTGFYHNTTVMQSFKGLSPINTIHDGDREAERKLFEFVDKEVQAKFLPKPQTA